MIKIYYKIWVSLFLKISSAQNDSKFSLILSLIVLTSINILNCFLICLILITAFHVDFDFLHAFYSKSRYLTIISSFLIFLLPNYFLLIFNDKHQLLLDFYQNKNIKNLGLNYFLISGLTVIVYIFILILFPSFFGLVNTN